MNVYDYVAVSNPTASKDIINSFGYQIKRKSNMGSNLKHLVAVEGEPALKMILENHPDKDVLLEIYGTPKGTHVNCGCDSCKEGRIVEKFLNANGNGVTDAKKAENNFSLVFLAGVLALSIAIISKK